MQRRASANKKENTREKEQHLSFRSGIRRCGCDGVGQRRPGCVRTELELVNDDGPGSGQSQTETEADVSQEGDAAL